HALDLVRVHVGHFAGGARQFEAGGVAVDVVDQAAAVEAAGGTVATPAVRRADQGHGAEQHVVGGGDLALGAACGFAGQGGWGGAAATGRAGAGGQQGDRDGQQRQ